MLSSTATNSHYIISWVLVLVPVRELVATALEEVVWELAVVVSGAVQELFLCGLCMTVCVECDHLESESC
jgi:hypothetical protein